MNRIDPRMLFFKPPGTMPAAAKTAANVKPARDAPGRAQSPADEYRSLRPEARTIQRRSFTPLARRGEIARPLASAEVERGRLEAASRDFEAVFLRYLTSAMRETIPDGGTGSVKGAHFYQGMIDEQLGRMLADSGRGLGLAQALSRGPLGGQEDQRD